MCAAGAFGMELRGENVERRGAEPLDAIIVKIEPRDLDIVRQTGRAHGKAVIVRRDFDVPVL